MKIIANSVITVNYLILNGLRCETSAIRYQLLEPQHVRRSERNSSP